MEAKNLSLWQGTNMAADEQVNQGVRESSAIVVT